MNLYLRLLVFFFRRRKSEPLGIWESSRTPFRVLPTDLDALGHMNNGKYLTIMDIARIDLMMRAGYLKKLRSRGWYPVVAGQTISYHRSLKPFQKFEVATRILGQNAHGVVIEQIFYVRSTLIARAVVRARFLKKSGGVVTPDEIESLVGGFPASMVLPDDIEAWTAANRYSARDVSPNDVEQ